MLGGGAARGRRGFWGLGPEKAEGSKTVVCTTTWPPCGWLTTCIVCRPATIGTITDTWGTCATLCKPTHQRCQQSSHKAVSLCKASFSYLLDKQLHPGTIIVTWGSALTCRNVFISAVISRWMVKWSL